MAGSNLAPLHAIPISEHVYWVGAIDWNIRDFHGYATQRGTTYNAYLVLGDQITLIDTVKAPFKEEMLTRIASIVDPREIAYVISNHAEMDHSGCLPDVIASVNPERVFASAQGVKALKEHFHHPYEIEAVPDGGTMMLGGRAFTFLETRMLHWPDSMFTYLADDGVLFTNDAFGMHLATTERFDDEVSLEILDYEAEKYFANILLPYANLVTKLIARLPALDWPVRVLATDHGPVWRSRIDRILTHYTQWAEQRPTDKALVLYDTMWGSTARMAQAVGDGLLVGGAKVKLMQLGSSHRSDVATELLTAGALLVGSPTLNNHMFPTMADVLTYIKGLRRRNLIGGIFGSYGWGGEATTHMHEMLTGMKVELPCPDVKVKYVPDAAALDACFTLGQCVAAQLRATRSVAS
jgi:flavorubredoxin